jgi:hypothetical protein
MALSNFGELKTSIAAELTRTGDTAFVAKVPDFVRLFEVNFQRDTTHRLQQTTDTLSLAASGESVALPSDYVSAEAVILESSPKVTLENKTIRDLFNEYPSTATARPAAYAILGSTMYLRPPSDAAYSITLFYNAGLTALSDDTDTNWLLTNYPDIYLYGSLVHSAPYLEDDGRLQVWLGLYDRAIAALKGESARAVYSGAPLKTQLDVMIV